MRKTPGTVRDIRTGRALARTSSLTDTFTSYVKFLMEQEEQFYLVHGPLRHLEVRVLVSDLRQVLDGVPIIYDRQLGADRIYVFEGDPAELGFAV